MRQRRGFTLVELMMTVGIIGVLASIAIPLFRDYGNRAKLTEQAVFVPAMNNEMMAAVVATGKCPDGTTYQLANDTPPSVGLGPKRYFDPDNDPDWKALSTRPEGYVYGSYSAYCRTPSFTYDAEVYVWVHMDVDQDGVPFMNLEHWYDPTDGSFFRTSFSDDEQYNSQPGVY